MPGKLKYLTLLVISLLLSGCVSKPVDTGELILGRWQSEIAGFTVTSEYSASQVSIDGHSPVSYSLDGDRLTIGNDAVSVRVVSFPDRDQMVQLDPLTQTTQVYERL